MPIFESQKSRNKRLFETVSLRLYHRFSDLITDESDKEIYLALLAGGTIAANGVAEACEYIKRAWGKGDEEKALALIKLFTLYMLSVWCRWVEKGKQYPEHERRQVRKVAASDILQLFGDNSEKSIKDFLDMDTQYNYELDNNMKMIKMSFLVIAKACEACGKNYVNWGRVVFPIKELQDVVDARAISDLRPFINDVATLLACEAAALEVTTNIIKGTSKSHKGNC
jgi:hypothetical protein